jgi:hypothetical protein
MTVLPGERLHGLGIADELGGQCVSQEPCSCRRHRPGLDADDGGLWRHVCGIDLGASSGAVRGNPSWSMTRLVTTSLVNSAMYESTSPATTSSFLYAAAVVDPSIDANSCVVDTNLVGS